MSNTVTVRFAPSPTGKLHVGNGRMALINGLFAAKAKGRFILRLDDTDAERSRAEYADAIQCDLAWMGLHWDALERQSDRMARYDDALQRLKDAGRVYPCYETPEELEYKRRRLLARHRPPVYDRAGLDLTDEARAAHEAEGRKPHWRFKLNHDEISWHDLVRGPVSFQGKNLSDPVIVRGDGSFLYMLPSAVDDIDMAVTHVLRGEDHVANTAVQTQMFEALGSAPPAFAHLPLMTDIGGKGLSKRLGSLTLESLRDDGIEALALASYLAHLGTPENIEPAADFDALVRGFDIARYGRASPKFDKEQLQALNIRQLHSMSFEDVRNRLSDMALERADDTFWLAARPNLERLGDVKIWYDVCFGTVTPVIADADFAACAAALLPPGPWDETTWKTWTGAVKNDTGRKGRDLFLPLRLALTGYDHGPELKSLLPIIGRETALRRLGGETA